MAHMYIHISNNIHIETYIYIYMKNKNKNGRDHYKENVPDSGPGAGGRSTLYKSRYIHGEK